jgi:hypothetical protein
MSILNNLNEKNISSNSLNLYTDWNLWRQNNIPIYGASAYIISRSGLEKLVNIIIYIKIKISYNLKIRFLF